MTHRSLALVLMSWAALSAGCSSYDYGWKCRTDRCADIPCGAIPPPAGTYSCRWQSEQIARAQQDFFVIHQTEWYLGGKQLGPDGRKHVREIAKRLGEGSCPVIISATDDDKLNAARKQAVVESLLQFGVFDADSRVVSGESEAEGLYGQEAVRYGAARLQGGGTATGAGGGLGAGGGGLGTPGSGFGVGTTYGGGMGGGGLGVY